jgi:hypothetical protein
MVLKVRILFAKKTDLENYFLKFNDFLKRYFK